MHTQPTSGLYGAVATSHTTGLNRTPPRPARVPAEKPGLKPQCTNRTTLFTNHEHRHGSVYEYECVYAYERQPGTDVRRSVTHSTQG